MYSFVFYHLNSAKSNTQRAGVVTDRHNLSTLSFSSSQHSSGKANNLTSNLLLLLELATIKYTMPLKE
jgi:hypothetical protein